MDDTLSAQQEIEVSFHSRKTNEQNTSEKLNVVSSSTGFRNKSSDTKPRTYEALCAEYASLDKLCQRKRLDESQLTALAAISSQPCRAALTPAHEERQNEQSLSNVLQKANAASPTGVDSFPSLFSLTSEELGSIANNAIKSLEDKGILDKPAVKFTNKPEIDPKVLNTTAACEHKSRSLNMSKTLSSNFKNDETTTAILSTIPNDEYIDPLQNKFTSDEDTTAIQNKFTSDEDTSAVQNKFTSDEGTSAVQNKFTIDEDTSAIENKFTSDEDTASIENKFTSDEDKVDIENKFTSDEDTTTTDNIDKSDEDTFSLDNKDTSDEDTASLHSKFTINEDATSLHSKFTNEHNTTSKYDNEDKYNILLKRDEEIHNSNDDMLSCDKYDLDVNSKDDEDSVSVISTFTSNEETYSLCDGVNQEDRSGSSCLLNDPIIHENMENDKTDRTTDWLDQLGNIFNCQSH